MATYGTIVLSSTYVKKLNCIFFFQKQAVGAIYIFLYLQSLLFCKLPSFTFISLIISYCDFSLYQRDKTENK